MRQFIIILISVLGILYSSIQVVGDTAPAKTVPVKKNPKKDLDPEGRRVPGHIIYCSISIENGVEIPGWQRRKLTLSKHMIMPDSAWLHSQMKVVSSNSSLRTMR